MHQQVQHSESDAHAVAEHRARLIAEGRFDELQKELDAEQGATPSPTAEAVETEAVESKPVESKPVEAKAKAKGVDGPSVDAVEAPPVAPMSDETSVTTTDGFEDAKVVPNLFAGEERTKAGAEKAKESGGQSPLDVLSIQLKGGSAADKIRASRKLTKSERKKKRLVAKKKARAAAKASIASKYASMSGGVTSENLGAHMIARKIDHRAKNFRRNIAARNWYRNDFRFRELRHEERNHFNSLANARDAQADRDYERRVDHHSGSSTQDVGSGSTIPSADGLDRFTLDRIADEEAFARVEADRRAFEREDELRYSPSTNYRASETYRDDYNVYESRSYDDYHAYNDRYDTDRYRRD